MEDIRLPEEKFEYRGREYILRCNMNVIADVQDMCGGVISPAIEDHASLKGCLCWLAAMMHDYADEQAIFAMGVFSDFFNEATGPRGK